MQWLPPPASCVKTSYPVCENLKMGQEFTPSDVIHTLRVETPGSSLTPSSFLPWEDTVQEMGTHVCLPIPLYLLRARKALLLAHSRSPLPDPPGRHAALPGSSLCPRACHLADCPSPSLPSTTWCLPSYGCSWQSPGHSYAPSTDPEPQSRCLETSFITKTSWFFFSSLSHSLFI